MKASDLRIGNRVRLTHVPEADLRDSAKQPAEPGLMPTATVLEHLIATQPIVTISNIDEWGRPWFDAEFVWEGEEQHHSIALFDDDSWEPVVGE